MSQSLGKLPGCMSSSLLLCSVKGFAFYSSVLTKEWLSQRRTDTTGQDENDLCPLPAAAVTKDTA